MVIVAMVIVTLKQVVAMVAVLLATQETRVKKVSDFSIV